MRRGVVRWGWRAAWAGVLAVVAVVGASAVELDPEPVRVTLLVLVVVAVAGLLLDAVAREAPVWATAPLHQPLGTGHDRATQAYLRLLESHRTARHPDGAVRDRLRALAGQALLARHGVRLEDPEAATLLDPQLRAVLAGPPSRLSPRRLDHLLRTIEEL